MFTEKSNFYGGGGGGEFMKNRYSVGNCLKRAWEERGEGGVFEGSGVEILMHTMNLLKTAFKRFEVIWSP